MKHFSALKANHPLCIGFCMKNQHEFVTTEQSCKLGRAFRDGRWTVFRFEVYK